MKRSHDQLDDDQSDDNQSDNELSINDILLPEMIIEIFFRLSGHNLLKCRRVSMDWFQKSNDLLLWDNLFEQTFGKPRMDKTLWTESFYKTCHLSLPKSNTVQLINHGINNHYIALVKNLLIKNKVEPIVQNQYQQSFIYNASMKGLTDVVEALIIYGHCKPDDTTTDYPNALYIACQENHLVTVELLIKHKANIEFKYKDQFTPLYMVCQENKIDIARYLLDHGANINTACSKGSTPLYVACQNGYIELVDLLCRYGADTESRYGIGYTPLYIACSKGHLNIVMKLISFGANKNATTDTGLSPIYIASQNGFHEIVEFLIGINTYLDMPYDGNTPLFTACDNGNTEVVEHLLKSKKVSINSTLSEGCTPLYVACCNGHHKIVSCLIDYGANCNIMYNEYTPLHIATSKNHYEIVKELLMRGNVDVNYYHPTKSHVLYVACTKNLLDIAKLLVEYGASTSNAKTKDDQCFKNNENLLHVAFRDNFPEPIISWLVDTFPQFLLEKNDNGLTPIDIAQNGNHEIILNKINKKID